MIGDTPEFACPAAAPVAPRPVGIVKEVEGETIRLATLNDGEPFGEMAIIDGGKRMASAVAREDGVVLGIPGERMEAKLAEYDPFLQAP